MNVNIENDYTVLVSKYEDRTYTESLETVIEDYKWSREGDTFETDDHLREDFEDYVRDYFELPSCNGSEEIEDYCTDFRIMNWEEILPELAYFIVPTPVKTCCDKAPKDSRYCNTCGNKL